MQEVIFQNGKLVLQKRKISQMDELFLIASKEYDKKKELELERLKDGGFNHLVKDFLFVEDSVFETMNTYFYAAKNEEILNIQTELKEQSYNELYRRKSNIEIKEQTDQIFRRKSNINNQVNLTGVTRRVSSLESKQDNITKRQIEELVHNKVGKFVKETFKNELTQTNIESIEQHKYARLSKGSYMTYRGENVEKMLKDFKPTENFIVDTELTNANATVFHDVKTGETVIAYRGIPTVPA